MNPQANQQSICLWRQSHFQPRSLRAGALSGAVLPSAMEGLSFRDPALPRSQTCFPSSLPKSKIQGHHLTSPSEPLTSTSLT